MNQRIPFILRLACFALCAAFFAQAADAQNNYQFARSIGGPGDGQTSAPAGAAVDSAGNVYVCDQGNNRIQKFDSGGNFLFAFGTYGTGDGQFQYPNGVATDGLGNVYVADNGNSRIEKFDGQGHFLLKFAGSGLLAADSAGNVYVGGNYVQKFDSSGALLLSFNVQGSGPAFENVITGLAIDSAGLVYVTAYNRYNYYAYSPTQIYDGQGKFLANAGVSGVAAVDSAGYFYAFGNSTIVKLDRSGNTLLTFGASGYGDGQFSNPTTLAVDAAGNIYVCDRGNNRIEKFGPNGAYLLQFGNKAAGDGQFNGPGGLALDGAGNLYVCDVGSNRIQKFGPNGAFLLKFGTRGGGAAQFYFPRALAVDGAGGIYVTDTSNNRIEKFDSQGNLLLTFGTYGSAAGQFNYPDGIAVDGAGRIYVADSGNSYVQIFNSSGVYSSQIGYSGFSGAGDGQLSYPESVTLDSSGGVYVLDSSDHRVEKFTSGGAYLSQFDVSGFGVGQYYFTIPSAIALDSAGSVYVADPYNERVLKFSSAGAFLTGFGSGYNGVPGAQRAAGGGGAYLNAPQGVAVDGAGNVFVGDSNNNRIAVFAPVNASVSGVLAFQAIAANAPAQNVTFTFRSNDGSADLAQTLSVPASGAFTLNGLFSKAGVLHIKPDKYLAANVSIDLSGGSLTGQNATLNPGDANNDNSVDSTDFGILIGAFGGSASVPGSGYDPTADFNGDGFVDSTDFGLLIGNFNNVGDL